MTGIFKDLLKRAKTGDPLAVAQLMDMYEPLIKREAKIGGEIDNDLLQELWETMFRCVQIFEK